MSVALAMMAGGMALGVIGGIQKEEALKQQRKIQKYNEESLMVQTKTQSALIIENQHKSFSAFMSGFDSNMSSQENYLNATGYDERGTVRQGVYQQQKEDFYGSQQTTESNIKDVESQMQLSLLGQLAQNEVNKYNYKKAIVDNRMETLTKLFGGASQASMATGVFGGASSGGVSGSVGMPNTGNVGAPLLGYGNNTTMIA